MEGPYLNANIDVRLFEKRFRGAIISDLIALENTLKTISNPDFLNFPFVFRHGITQAHFEAPPFEYIEQREINKCFKSIMGAFHDYIDNLLAAHQIMDQKILNKKVYSEEHGFHLLNDLFKSMLLDISSDRSLTTQKKLERLFYKEGEQIYINVVLGYFQIRNGLEHHKGIAKRNRVIQYYRLKVLSSSGEEVKPPLDPDKNGRIIIKADTEEISFDEGGQMLITKDQLDGIVMSILIYLIPQFQQTFLNR